MRMLRFLPTGILVVIGIYVFGQRSTTVMPVGERIFVQSAINYGYNDGGYWSCIGDSNKLSMQLRSVVNCTNCLFVLKESSEKGIYEIFSVDGSKVNLSFSGTGSAIHQFSFHHICNGLFKIYDRSGDVVCWENDSIIGICADSKGAEACWYLMDADSYEPLKYEDDTIIVKHSVPKRSEFYAQIRANYYQYGTKVPLFFERLTFLDLRCREFGEIVLALNDCTSIMDQTERVLLVLKGMSKNTDKTARRYVYNEIEKVNFRRPNIVSKATIERYFAERTQEADPELVVIVERIKKKMLTGLTFRVR